MRLDKWLWAARFFKTRSQAAAAAEGGKVKLNGAAAKPARELKPGDRLMSVKSTTVALSFTPAEIWQEKFRRRGLVAAAANVDRLDVF